MRLTTKLSLSLTLLSTAVLAGSLSLLYYAEKRHLYVQAENAQKAGLDRMARVCADSILDDNELARLTYLKTFWASSETPLAYLVLLDDQGKVVMHSDFLRDDFSLQRKPWADEAVENARKAPGFFEQKILGPRRLWVISRPIQIRDKRWTLAVAYDQAALDGSVREVQRESLWRFSAAAWLGVLLSLLLALLLAHALSRPIRELSVGAQKIGQGRFQYRIAENRQDELGDLAKEFNAMGSRLAELDELKDSFLAKITHDLRNPLSAMIGYVDMLLMGIHGPVNPDQAQALKVVSSNGDYLGELINNILDMTKLEAGRMQFAQQAVTLRPSVQDVVELMKVKADEYRVSLDCSGVPSQWRVWVDPEALRRVLVNLIGNALKFTPAGGEIRVEWSQDAGQDRIAVRDTGIGIPEEKLSSLFTKFSQISETKDKARESKGTGLGLVICKEIVEAHGGRIGVESRFRRGATFFFTLPRPESAQAQLAVQAEDHGH